MNTDVNEPEAAQAGARGRGSLASAFWGWFVVGGIVSLALPVLCVFLLADSSGAGGDIALLALLAVPLYALAMLVLVWRRGAVAKPLWRWSSRLAVIAAYALVAVAALNVPGDYTVHAKVLEGANVSAPARTALGIACVDGTLAAGMSHEALGLAAAAEYAGQYTREVRASVTGPTSATVTVVLEAIPGSTGLFAGHGVRAGDTLVYTGTCAPDAMRWSIGGSVDERYRPKG